jgi:hypothetical protein
MPAKNAIPGRSVKVGRMVEQRGLDIDGHGS